MTFPIGFLETSDVHVCVAEARGDNFGTLSSPLSRAQHVILLAKKNQRHRQ